MARLQEVMKMMNALKLDELYALHDSIRTLIQLHLLTLSLENTQKEQIHSRNGRREFDFPNKGPRFAH